MDRTKPRQEPVIGDVISGNSVTSGQHEKPKTSSSQDDSLNPAFLSPKGDFSDVDSANDSLAKQIVNASLNVKMDSQTNHVLTDTYRRFLLAKEWLEYREKSLKNYTALMREGKLPLEQRGKEQKFFHFEDSVAPQIMRDHPQKVETDDLGFYEGAASAILAGQAGSSNAAILSQAYLSAQFEQYVKERHPHVYNHFEKTIQDQINSLYQHEPKKPEIVVQRAAAIEYLLHKTYPTLRNELEVKAQQEPHSNYKFAFGILSKTAMVLNPAPALVSYTVGALLKTDAMKPFVQSVASATAPLRERVKLVAEPAARKLLGILPQEHGGKVLAGLAVAGVAALYLGGLITEDDAMKLKDGVVAFVENTVDNIGNGFEHAQHLAYEHGVVGDRPLSLSPTPLSDGVSFESAMNPTTDASAPENAGVASVGDAAPVSGGDQAVEIPRESLTARPEDILGALESQPSVDVSSTPGLDSSLNQNAHAELSISNYKIVSGDCLSMIAQAQFESAGVPYDYNMITAYVNEIAALNEISDPNFIRAGEELQIPPFSGVEVSHNPIPQSVLDEATNSLYQQAVAQNLYELEPNITLPESPLSAWGTVPDTLSVEHMLSVGSGYASSLPSVPPADVSQWGVVPEGLEHSPSAEDLLSPFSADPQVEQITPQASVSPRPRF